MCWTIVLGDSALHTRACTKEELWTAAAPEYDGEAHRDQETHRADLTRERPLVEIDWQRVGFTSPQLLYEGGSIIAGIDRLLGRTWDPRRVVWWERLLGESLLRAGGRAKSQAPLAACYVTKVQELLTNHPLQRPGSHLPALSGQTQLRSLADLRPRTG